jgi:hypothetical protein
MQLSITLVTALAATLAAAAPAISPEVYEDEVAYGFTDDALLSNYTLPADVFPLLQEENGVTRVILVNSTIADEQAQELGDDAPEFTEDALAKRRKHKHWTWIRYGLHQPSMKREDLGEAGEVLDKRRKHKHWTWIRYGLHQPSMKREDLGEAGEVLDKRRKHKHWTWIRYGLHQPSM